MASAEATRPRPGRPGLRQLRLRHPELGAAAAVIAAWLALAGYAAWGTGAPGMPGRAATMAGMGVPVAHQPWAAAASGIPWWLLMTVAMMGPTALAAVRHVGLTSLPWRRGRAMAGFAAAYLTVWAAFGLLALAAAAALPGVPGPGALAAVLAAAAAWQLTPLKWQWLRSCHRHDPLPLHGRRAAAGAVLFGLRNALSCLGSCWCLMLIMAAAPAGQLLWTTGVTGAMTAEMLARRPRRATRAVAAALGYAAVATLATGNLLR